MAHSGKAMRKNMEGKSANKFQDSKGHRFDFVSDFVVLVFESDFLVIDFFNAVIGEQKTPKKPTKSPCKPLL